MTPESSDFIAEFKVTGLVNLQLFNPKGTLIDDRTIRNMVVTNGKNWIAARCKDTGIPTQCGWMSIGTGGATALDAAQTTLATNVPSTGFKKALDTAGGTVSGSSITYVAEFTPSAPAGATGAITEAALYYTSTDAAGGMIARTIFGTITKNSGDTLKITWTLTIN
jgi:hypothetical protein